jgi:hypothetical protein
MTKAQLRRLLAKAETIHRRTSEIWRAIEDQTDPLKDIAGDAMCSAATLASALRSSLK